MKQLTKKERAWVDELERVLLACPRRLELVTVGDRNLRVVDRTDARNSDLADGAVVNIKLAFIRSGCGIHGVSG